MKTLKNGALKILYQVKTRTKISLIQNFECARRRILELQKINTQESSDNA